MTSAPVPFLAANAPAAGAPLDQVVIASVAASVVLAELLGIGLARRAGRDVGLAGAERLASRAFGGVPGWAALPVAVATFSLLSAVLGLYWDVSTHIDDGRDDGPLANSSHYRYILNVASLAAASHAPLMAPYAASKAGVEALTNSSASSSRPPAPASAAPTSASLTPTSSGAAWRTRRPGPPRR